MQLFYHAEISSQDQQVLFSREESKHIVKVLRKNVGDNLLLTNGKGQMFSTEILLASPNGCRAKITSVRDASPLPYRLHMAVAPTKMNDRYEWFLEKATEIGVHEITPVICDHSERKVVKTNRFERVLQSAMKQSLNAWLPKLNEPVPFSEFMRREDTGHRFIAHCEQGVEKNPLGTQVQKNQETTILIGPEGDFSSEEIKAALDLGWKPVSLGKSRLRTETAAIVACHTVALLNEI